MEGNNGSKIARDDPSLMLLSTSLHMRFPLQAGLLQEGGLVRVLCEAHIENAYEASVEKLLRTRPLVQQASVRLSRSMAVFIAGNFGECEFFFLAYLREQKW